MIQLYINRLFCSIWISVKKLLNPPLYLILELVEKWVAVQSNILFILVRSIKKINSFNSRKNSTNFATFFASMPVTTKVYCETQQDPSKGCATWQKFWRLSLHGLCLGRVPPTGGAKPMNIRFLSRETANSSFLCERRNQRPFTVPPKVEESVVIRFLWWERFWRGGQIAACRFAFRLSLFSLSSS